MKRIVVLVLALAMMFTLVACGQTDEKPAAEVSEDASAEVSEDVAVDDTEEPAEVAGDDEYTIVMVAKHEGITWFDDMRIGVDAFGEEYENVNAYQIAPEGGDPAKQVQMVEDLIAQGVDAILVVPNDAQSMAPVLQKAREAGIIVIAHEASDITDSVDYDMEAFINENHGVTFAENLAELMGGEGQYVSFVGALTMTTHMQWFNSMKEHLDANYPDIEFVIEEPFEDKNDNKIAYDKTIEILKAYPDIKGITDCAASGAGIAQALQDKNRNDIALVSTAVPSQAYTYVQDGFLDVGLCWRPADAGYVTCLMAYNLLTGVALEDGMSLEKPGYETVTVDGNVIFGNAPLVFTAENLDSPECDF